MGIRLTKGRISGSLAALAFTQDRLSKNADPELELIDNPHLARRSSGRIHAHDFIIKAVWAAK